MQRSTNKLRVRFGIIEIMALIAFTLAACTQSQQPEWEITSLSVEVIDDTTAQAVVKGEFVNGCGSVEDIRLEFDDNQTLELQLTTSSIGIACPPETQIFEETVEFGIEDLPNGTYTVAVGGPANTFIVGEHTNNQPEQTQTAQQRTVNGVLCSGLVAGGSTIIRINAGEATFINEVEEQGQIVEEMWEADECYVDTSRTGPLNATSPNSSFDIINNTTAPEQVLDKVRWIGDDLNLSYDIPVVAGEVYVVRLYFAETWVNEAGSRIFDVTIENELVLEDYDVYQDSGGKFLSVAKTFVVMVEDDILDIEVLQILNGAMINALEVIPVELASDEDEPIPLDIGEIGNMIGCVGDSVTAQVRAAGRNISFSASNLPNGISINEESGLLSGTLQSDEDRTSDVVEVTIRDNTQTFQDKSVSFEWSIFTRSTAGPNSPVHINAGENEVVEVVDETTQEVTQTWVPDVCYVTPGEGADLRLHPGGREATVSGEVDAPLDAVDRERWVNNGNMIYSIPVIPDTEYTVILYFAEIAFDQPGQRIFNVLLEDISVLTDFDLFNEADGAGIVIQRDFTVIPEDSSIDIEFSKLVDNPKVNALEIISTNSQ